MKRPNLLAATRFIRLRYILPRAAIVTAIAMAFRYGLDPMLKWAFVASGEAASGAKVEIGALTTSLTGGELTITGFAAANPNKPMRDLVEAEQIRLHVDAGQLLRKRVVVHEGLISGMRFDMPRATSGALDATPAEEDAGPSIFDPLVSAAGDQAAAWFDGLSGNVEADLAAKLQTPALVEQLQARWPQQYAALQTRVEELRKKALQIQTDFAEVKKNPLRNLTQMDKLQSDLTATQAELQKTLADINALPAQAKADRDAIDAARKHDEEFLKQSANVSNIDGEQLSKYLLGDAAGGYLSQTVSWISWARNVAPAKKLARPERSRGVDVVFGPRRPKCLIEQVKLAGAAQVNGMQLDLTGELTDAASEPELLDRPMRLHLAGRGALVCDLVAEVDRRTETPHDHLTLDIPSMALGAQTLGKADKLAVKVAAGNATVKADVHLDGDQIAGVIELQQATTLEPAVPALKDQQVAALLHDSLKGVDHLDATVRLAGTLKKPDVKIESNVGPQLAGAVGGALRRYAADRRDKLMAGVQAKVDQQVAQLDQQRQKAQKELLAKLGENQQIVSQLGPLLGRGGAASAVSLPQLGKALSLDKLRR